MLIAAAVFVYLSSHLQMIFAITPAAIDKTKFVQEFIHSDPLSVASMGSDNTVIVTHSDKLCNIDLSTLCAHGDGSFVYMILR